MFTVKTVLIGLVHLLHSLVSNGKITPPEIEEAAELGHEWAEQHGLNQKRHGGPNFFHL